ncbi:hypothetical protein NE857_30555 [Nocardiopsis exhalans]|uniref:Uncharacterized protein n=2 Tax=Nocardiopsis TaxID=2013 RepID=A0A840WCK8_9ACTN|nr:MULTISPECIES: hypothetical protein [Nocardiopsis]MBB5493133.1 hypothetical protein [Nocardiopsis metallicus]USY19531.1 hypothetical protein NE857_30555 [Nocardiopsis exhalans]
MEQTPLPSSLQASIARIYRWALREVTEARAVPENYIRESVALSREVFGNAVAELLAQDAAETFARMFAAVGCARRGCANDATFTDATFYEESWCSRGCRQWERRNRVREQCAAEREPVAA